MATRKRKTVLEQAATILGARACSVFELRSKLQRREGLDPAEIEDAIKKLQDMGFLSDEQFAEDFVRVQRARNFGRQRIYAKLMLKGISREIANKYLNRSFREVSPIDDAMNLLDQRRSRIEAIADPQKKRRHILSALANRGFSADVAYEALDRYLSVSS